MSIIHEGTLKGSFRGFKDRDTVFEFTDGSMWKQNEYKYNYHYSYRPQAKIVERNSRYFIEVDGMNDTVEVVKIK